MSKSITYYLTLLVIRIKGIKKKFSQEPIDYLELRKEDIYTSEDKYFKLTKVTNFVFAETKITEIKSTDNSKKLLIYIHGGAFISGPSQHHWDAIKKIAKATNYTIWMCDYPKAPEHKILKLNNNIDLVYKTATEKYNTENIVLIGDSAGGTLIISLVQRLIQKKQVLPSKIVLISPVLDSSFENPKIDKIDKQDPMLSKKGLLSAKKMCIEDGNLKNESISPIYGSFEGFPTTYLFIAENDITCPDQQIFCERLKILKIEHYINFGKGMPHIWPLLPVMKESKIALNEIVKILNK
jgi:acetyl esterase/lipase